MNLAAFSCWGLDMHICYYINFKYKTQLLIVSLIFYVTVHIKKNTILPFHISSFM